MKLRHQVQILYPKLFAKRFFYKWNRFLFHLSLKGLGINNCHKNTSGEYAFLKQFLENKENPLILDVGANIGNWSRMALELNPSSQIFAFEPNQKVYEILCAEKRIKSFFCACGEQAETAILYDRDDQALSEHASLEKSVIQTKEVKESCVKVITIDDFIEEHKISKVDLLKIDTEGFEYNVLQGCKKSIALGKIESICFEFNDMNVKTRRFYRDFVQLLDGYTFYRLLPKGKLPMRKYDPVLHEIFAFQNLLAIKE